MDQTTDPVDESISINAIENDNESDTDPKETDPDCGDHENSEHATNAILSSQFRQLLANYHELVRYIKLFSRYTALLWELAPKGAVFLIIILLAQSLIPAITVSINKKVVDIVSTVIPGEAIHWATIITIIALWFLVIVLSNVSDPWINAVSVNLSDELAANINLELMKKANSFTDITHFEDAEFYNELSIIQGKASSEPFRILNGLLKIFRQVITLVTMLGLLFTVSWWIPLLILVTFLPQAYVSFRMELDIWNINLDKAFQSRLMRNYSGMMLARNYAKEVRLFDLYPLCQQRYLEVFEDKHQALTQVRNQQAMTTTALGLLSTLGNALSFVWVILQATSGNLTAGNVLLLIQSLAYVQSNINGINQRFLTIQRSVLFLEMFFKFMDTESTMPVSLPGEPIPTPIKSGITFDNVGFAYPDGRMALSGISLTFKAGETVAIVGENGAGKSTLVKLLARFYDPTQGTISVDGTDIKDLNLTEWRQKIGAVFQDFCRYPFTIGDNIALGDVDAMDDMERLKDASQKSEISTQIEQLPQGYETLLGKQFNGTELSGGQWQKIAIARAFIREKNAQLMILDEPTAALDPRSEYEIYSSFTNLVNDKIAILVTHRLASVQLADRILVLKAGQLVEMGTHEELLQKNGEYATLWNMQAKYYQTDSQMDNQELIALK